MKGRVGHIMGASLALACIGAGVGLEDRYLSYPKPKRHDEEEIQRERTKREARKAANAAYAAKAKAEAEERRARRRAKRRKAPSHDVLTQENERG